MYINIVKALKEYHTDRNLYFTGLNGFQIGGDHYCTSINGYQINIYLYYTGINGFQRDIYKFGKRMT